MFFNILPLAVQTRIPQLPSLRRTISAYNVRKEKRNNASSQQIWSESLEVGFVEEASATSTPSLSRPSSSRSSVLSSPPAEGGCTTAPSPEWRYATNGINLLETVISEAEHSSPKNQAFSRQQYIHTLAYLLHGAPKDLSHHEQEILLAALPEQLQRAPQTKDEPSSYKSTRGRSLVHRLLASGIVHIFLFFQVFLPYFKHLLRILYQFERTNHISERVLAISLSTAESIGKAGSDLLGIILKSGNGRIIQLGAAISIWWIREVSNGIHEGVEGCVEIADQGKRPDRTSRRRNDAL